MRDRFLRCQSCGVRFLWVMAEQASGNEPALCPGCRVLSPPEGRQRGVVKFYNATKGWGFIVRTAGGDVFVHRSGLADAACHPLREGDLVEFGLEETPRGPQANGVQRLEVGGTDETVVP